MRLLNVHKLSVEEFLDADATPRYAILSHTWGEEEVTFQDMRDGTAGSKLGYHKIEGLCRQAARDKYDYVWADTCCIDRKDPAELSEAINSMFQWYRRSAVCYAHLADVDADEEGRVGDAALAGSRWFTRGWTLQELLAPDGVVFLDRHWQPFGKCKLTHDAYPYLPDIGRVLPSITRIPGRCLIYGQWLDTTAAQRLSWAARRRTTRKEDMAYCLLGILGVNMPLLYGEGDRAFVRLQEEYIRQHNDPSLLAWGLGVPCAEVLECRMPVGALAPSPSFFAGFSSLAYLERTSAPSTFACTNNGVEVELLLLTLDRGIKFAIFGTDADLYARYRRIPWRLSLSARRLLPWRAVLGGGSSDRGGGGGSDASSSQNEPVIAVPLFGCPAESRRGFEVYERAVLCPPFFISEDWCRLAEWKRVHLKRESSWTDWQSEWAPCKYSVDIDTRRLEESGFRLTMVWPPRHVEHRRQDGRISIALDDVRPLPAHWIFTFEGPISLSLGLFVDEDGASGAAGAKNKNGKRPRTESPVPGRPPRPPVYHAMIGEMDAMDVLCHQLSGGGVGGGVVGALLLAANRHNGGGGGARGPRGFGQAMRRQLRETQSIRIPGSRLGRPGAESATASVSAGEFRPGEYGTGRAFTSEVTLRWEVQPTAMLAKSQSLRWSPSSKHPSLTLRGDASSKHQSFSLRGDLSKHPSFSLQSDSPARSR